MNLTETRQQVAADLRDAGLKVKDHIPAKVVPPLVILGTGDPYVEEGSTFANTNMVVNLELFCVVGTQPNAEAMNALDEMIETVIFNLGDWSVAGVSAPFMASANDAQYLTSRISINNTFELGGTE